MGILYKLNFINGKSYIGISTQSIERRFSAHRTSCRERDTALCAAWRKYGQPSYAVLAYIENGPLLLDAERKAIVVFGTLAPGGYNITSGGDSDHTIETSKRMALARLGKPLSSAHRKKISLGQRGRIHSDATKDKIRQRAIGRKATDEAKKKMSSSRLGKAGLYTRTAETKRKLSEFRKEYWRRMRIENPKALRDAAKKQGQSLARSWHDRKAADVGG